MENTQDTNKTANIQTYRDLAINMIKDLKVGRTKNGDAASGYFTLLSEEGTDDTVFVGLIQCVTGLPTNKYHYLIEIYDTISERDFTPPARIVKTERVNFMELATALEDVATKFCQSAKEADIKLVELYTQGEVRSKKAGVTFVDVITNELMKKYDAYSFACDLMKAVMHDFGLNDTQAATLVNKANEGSLGNLNIAKRAYELAVTVVAVSGDTEKRNAWEALVDEAITGRIAPNVRKAISFVQRLGQSLETVDNGDTDAESEMRLLRADCDDGLQEFIVQALQAYQKTVRTSMN